MGLIGYARVSTEDQKHASQLDALRNASCTTIFEEAASGANRNRPQLELALATLRAGDTLVVTRIDRLARSLSHLLEVIETVTSRGAFFRSLGDPIDTSNPQGRFAMQILGAVAELERALIRERTLAGLAAARARGRLGGNPALKKREATTLQRVANARREGFFKSTIKDANEWLPIVRKLRPDRPWAEIVRRLNAHQPQRKWTTQRLRRAVRLLISEGLAQAELAERSPKSTADSRQMVLVAGIARANKDLTLHEIRSQLEAMRERAPRGGKRWAVSTIHGMLKRAQSAGLL